MQNYLFILLKFDKRNKYFSYFVVIQKIRIVVIFFPFFFFRLLYSKHNKMYKIFRLILEYSYLELIDSTVQRR